MSAAGNTTNCSHVIASFDKARSEFLSTLTVQEQKALANCSSPDILKREIASIEKSHKTRFSHTIRASENVKRFTESFKPYFQVVDTLVQSHPEFAALVWGSTKFIFQLTSNFATFFEKLNFFMTDLTFRLPSYGEIVSIPGLKRSSRLVESIQLMYTDLLVFYQKLIGIFRRPNGEDRTKLSVLGRLSWRSFEDTFNDFSARVQLHNEVLQHELLVTQLQSTGRIIELQELQARFSEKWAQANQNNNFIVTDIEEKLLRSRTWLSPPQFSDAFERAQDLCQEGTSTWLFKDTAYCKWESCDEKFSKASTSFGEGAFWVRGNPGVGKTVIASNTISRLRNSTDRFICYYFFRGDGADSDIGDDARRSLLSQLLSCKSAFEDLVDLFEFAMLNTPGQPSATSRQIRDLFQLCMPLVDCTVVLDGIDECSTASEIIEDILKINEKQRLKVIFFSRPAGPNVLSLHWAMPRSQGLDIGKSTCPDIYVYLQNHIRLMQSEGLLGPHSGLDQLLDRLVIGADGMFLWARLIIIHLRSFAFTPTQRVRIINRVESPEGLKQMYDRLLDRIGHAIPAERKLAHEILMWVICARRPLNVSELHEGIKMSLPLEADDCYPDFGHVATTLCAGLVELRESGKNRAQGDLKTRDFYVTHSTVREYCLPTPDDYQAPASAQVIRLSFRRLLCEIKISASCLRLLTNFTPAQPLSGDIRLDASTEEVDASFPLCRYASVSWIQHLGSTDTNKYFEASERNHLDPKLYCALLLSLSSFLKHKLVIMTWIEASYLSGRAPDFEILHQWSETALKSYDQLNDVAVTGSYRLDASQTRVTCREAIKDALEFSNELKSLCEAWSSHLLRSPCKIWKEVAAFTPSKFLASNSGFQFSSLVEDKISFDKISSQFLCKVSQTNHAERLTGILSIWSSSYVLSEQILPTRRTFEKAVMKKHFIQDTRALLEDFSSGWYGRYELWSIRSTPLKLCDIPFPLEEGEVRIQLRQSGHCHIDTWKVQFPIAVAQDARTFTVLRTVYSYQLNSNTKEAKLHSTQLPVTFHEGVAARWAPDHVRSRSDDWYLYHTFFSSDGRYVFLIDQFGILNHLAMFELNRTACFTAHIIAHKRAEQITTMDSMWGLPECSVSFHPFEPLVAVSARATAYLWNFLDVDLTITGVGLLSHRKLHKIEGASSITFSADGKIIAGTPGSPHPWIWEITRLTATKMLRDHSDQTPRPNMPVPLNTELSTLGQGIVTPHMSLVSPSENVVAKVSIENGSVTLSRATTARVQTQSVQHESVQSSVLEVSSLPRWPGVESAAASVFLPETEEERVRIVFDKGPQQWYDMASKPDTKFPAILDQDRRFIQPKSLVTTTGHSPPKAIPTTPEDITDSEGLSTTDTEEEVPDSSETSRPLDKAPAMGRTRFRRLRNTYKKVKTLWP